MAASDRIHPLSPFAGGEPRRDEPAPAAESASPHRRRAWPRRLAWTAVVLLALLVGAYLAAPTAARWYINRSINSTPDYQGQVGTVRLDLLRGAYQVDEVVVSRVGAASSDPFFTCARIDLALAWKQLLRGNVVARATFLNPVVSVAQVPADEQRRHDEGQAPAPEGQPPKGSEPGKPDTPWQTKLEEMFPFSIDEVRVIDGRLIYQDPAKHLDLSLGELQAVVTNLTNSEGLSGAGNRVATLKAEGVTVGGGKLRLSGDIDPFAEKPTFVLRASLEGLDLTAINELLKAYAKVDVERGTFSCYLDATADAGQLDGYMKPLFADLDVFKWGSDVKGEGLSGVWEAVVAGGAKVLQNQPKDRIASEIPLKGRIDAPGTGVVDAIVSLLKNAFIEALAPGFKGLEQAITGTGGASPDAPAKSGSHAQAQSKLEDVKERAD